MTVPPPPTAPPPRPLPRWFLALLPLALSQLIQPIFAPSDKKLSGLEGTFGFAILAFLGTLWGVPKIAGEFWKAGMRGRDLLKREGWVIPESLGLVPSTLYILLLFLFIPFPFAEHLSQPLRSADPSTPAIPFPHHKLSEYLSALLSLLTATLLGFLDDVFDIRWRYKLPIPIIASIPLLMVYWAERGGTDVVMPIPLRPYLGKIVSLGPLYYLYMSLLSTFCTNSINILAGVNGIEVGQALIIALSVALNDVLYLPVRWPLALLPASAPQSLRELAQEWARGGLARGSVELWERHLFSLYFMLPLVGAALGLLYHNWYPARVFPGDTFCYFSGMAFAVTGILSHFSKTLLLFFLPQIFNFLLSAPQLFGLVPCPRHRLPRLDPHTSLLHPSMTPFPRPPPAHTALILRLLSLLKLTRLTHDPHTGHITSATNLTLVSVLLVHFGPLREEKLARLVLGCQVLGSVAAFAVRYGAAWAVYDGDRR